jgi:alpha-ribazole phosphatase/probable phosphoglycerate mutase
VADQAKDPTAQIPGRGAPPARILLFRHGAAEGSEAARFISRTDVDLLPLGEGQVKDAAGRAAPWLGEGGPAGVPVYSSPLLRARRSAEIVCGALGLGAPRVIDEFIEIDLGRWEGETYESLMEKDPERMRAHYADFVRSKAPEGESLDDLARRVRPALERIAGEAEGSVAVIVAHAAVNRVILLDALGAPLENFFRIDVGLGSFSVIDFRAGAPLVRLVNG